MNRIEQLEQQLQTAQRQFDRLTQQLAAARTTAAASQARLHTLLDASPATTYSCQPTGDFACTYISRNVETLLGYTAAEFLAASDFWRQRLHPDDAPRVWAAIPTLFEDDILRHEYRLRHREGHYIWVRDELKLLCDEGGNPVEIVGYVTDISDRKATERSLQASDTFWRRITDLVPAAIYVYDVNAGRPVFINPTCAAITGYTLAELQALGPHLLTTLYHPDTRDVITEHDRRLLADTEDRVYEVEFIVQRKDGSSFWAYVRETVLSRHPDGTPAQILGIGLDMTDRQATDRALQASRDRLQATLAALPDIVLRVDHTGRYLDFYASNYTAELTGLDDLVGRTMTETLPDEVAQAHLQRLHQALQQQTVEVYEQQIQFDGETHYEEVRVAPCGDTEVVFVIRDVTARKEAEQQLRASQAKLAAILRYSPSVIYTKDLSGRHEFVNQAFLELLDCPRSAVLGKTNHELFEPTTATQLQAHDAWLLAQGEVQQFEETLRIGQTERVFLSSKFVVRDEQGEPYGLCGISTDITDRKAMEAELQASRDRLQAMLLALPDLVFRTNREGRYLDFYPSDFTLSLTAEVDNLVGHTMAEVLPPALAQAHLHRVDQALTTQTLQVSEQQLPLADETRYEEVRVAPCGRHEVLFVVRDITDRKCSEQQLKRQLAAIEAAADGIAILQNGQYLYLNSAHLELFGYTQPEALLGQSWKVLYSPAEQARLEAATRPALERDGAWVGEAIAIRQDGTAFDQRLSLTCTDDGLTICVCEDISDRKAAERALQASQALLQTVLDTAPVAIFWKDLQGVYQGANTKTAEVYGLASTADLMHRTDTQLVWPPAVIANIQAEDQHIITTQQPYLNILQHVVTTTGVAVWLEINKVPLYDDAGQLWGILGTAQDVTARIEADIERQDLTDRLTLALQAGAYGTWDWDLVQEAIWDDRMYEIYGLQALGRAATYQDWRALIHSDDRDAVEAQLQATLRSGVPFNVEFRIGRKDGQLRWVQGLAQLQHDSQGLPVRMVGINRDITDRKQAELDLAAYAARAEDLYNNAPCGYYSLDADGHITGINNTALRWLNYPREQVVGQPLTQFVCADSHPQLAERGAALAQSGPIKRLDYEITLLGSDGGRITVLINEEAQTDAEGRLLGSRSAATDIRQRLKSEALLRQQYVQEHLLREMTQCIRQSLDLPEILATVTQQVKQVLVCDRVLIFRLMADGDSGIAAEAVSPELPKLQEQNWELERWVPAMLEVYRQGQPNLVPDVMADGWGERLHDYYRQGPIKSQLSVPILTELFESAPHRRMGPHQQDTLWGVLVVQTGQTQRPWLQSEAQMLQQIANQLAIAIQQGELFNQLQAELLERQQTQQDLIASNEQLAIVNQELERATRLKDEFLANMSHELRTPLNAILGMTEGLQEAVFGPISARQRRSLDTIERSGTHLLSLINDILDLSKIEAGHLELDFAPVNVPSLCDSSLTFVKQQAHKKNLQVKAQVPAHLPELYGDERRLRQVLINLLTNAVKFTPAGGQITITATYRALTPEDRAHQRDCCHPQREPAATIGILSLAVTDTGIGISPENAPKLFQPFVQVDSALNRQYEGTGLGLALVKRTVELHGGQVELTSTVGQGSCFTLRLPIVTLTAERLSVSDRPPPSTPAAPLDRHHAPVILLAEDNDANINTTTAYLTAKGYDLIVAKTGIEAIDLAQAAHPDVILMDIQMPQLDGLAAIQQLRQTPELATVPIVALTALAMPDDQARCLAAGADAYLSKPIRLKQLFQLLQTLLPPPAE